MADLYANTSPSLTSPAIDGSMVMPDDTSDLPHVTRALYVGTGGQINVELASGVAISLMGIVGGTMLPLRVRKILASGTTASDIVGLW